MSRSVRQGTVEAVCRGDEKGRPKHPRRSIRLVPGLGVEGDAHAGTEKEVSLLAREDAEELSRRAGIEAPPGAFAENIATRGVILVDLAPGTVLAAGDAELEVIAVGKDPSIVHTYSYKGFSLLAARGVFARVVRGATLSPGDAIRTVRGGCSPSRRKA
jgi:MOSC domain-containing protein YiiM